MTYTLIVNKRESGKAEQTRQENLIPAVLYGSEIEPVSVAVDYNTFEKLYNEAGESSLIDFSVEGDKAEPVKILIQDIQYDPVKGRMIHIDFRQIKMDEEMHATIELSFVGESLAVKELGGTLNTGNDYVNVKCLPKDLVSEIEVDLSVLKTFDDVIKISDLKVPAGVTIVDNSDTVVAKVAAPLSEEQLKAMEESEAPSIEDVEVEGKEKKEDEEAEVEGDKKEDKKEEDKKD